MIAVLRVLISVSMAGLIAVAGYAGTPFLPAAVGLTLVLMAAGWGNLLGVPHPAGSRVVVAISGIAAVVTASLMATRAEPLLTFAGLLALLILLAFGHEILRGDGRADLVGSLTATFCGQVIAVLAASWVLLPGTVLGPSGVLLSATAAAASQLAVSLPWPFRTAGPVAIVAGAVASAAVAVTVTDILPTPAALLGAAVGALVAALDRLLAYQPSARQSIGLLAAALAPLSVAGAAGYAVARLVT